MDKYSELMKIYEEIYNCKRCPLYKSITNKVPGEGKIDLGIVFIGEAPGREEDKQGRPFVGKAGKLLTKAIEEILGIKRENVYITNVLKCRPPNNRDPKEEEIKACSIFLERQLEIIKPNVIVTLGRFSAKWVFNYFGLKFSKISQVRGKVYKAKKWGKDVYIIPTYHPAAILYHKQLEPLFFKDFEKIREILINLNILKGKSKKNFSLLDYVKK